MRGPLNRGPLKIPTNQCSVLPPRAWLAPHRHRPYESASLTSAKNDVTGWIPFGDHPLQLERYREY